MSEKHYGISPINHLSDGESVEEINTLKTNYKDMARRYELAERVIWSKSSNFKKKIVSDCRINGTDDCVFTDYVKDIIKLAQSQERLDENLPEVCFPKAVRIPDPAII